MVFLYTLTNIKPYGQWVTVDSMAAPFQFTIHSFSKRECEQPQFKNKNSIENAAENAEANVSMFSVNRIQLDKMKIGMCFDLFWNMSRLSVFFLCFCIYIYISNKCFEPHSGA